LEEAWLTALGKESRPEGQPSETRPARATAGDRRYPSTPAPLTLVARVDDKGVLFLRRTVTHYVPEQTTVKRPGQEDQTTTTYRSVTEEQEKSYQLSKVQVVGTDGKPLAPGTLQALLEKERAVLVSADGKPVDPFYLQVIKELTPILVLPEEAPWPPVPVPAFPLATPLAPPAVPPMPRAAPSLKN